MVNFYSQMNRQNGEEKKPTDPVPKTAGAVKPDYKKFTGSEEGLGAKEFTWAIWYVKNKLLLYRLVVGSLIVVCSLTIGFTLWRAFNILYFDLTAGQIMDRQLTMSVDYSALRAKFTPAPLEILNSFSLPNGKNKIDALAEVNNPNEKHVIYFDYYFDFGGVQTAKQKGFLLPMESRPVVVFGLDSAEFTGSPGVILENVRFKRISAHDVADTMMWQDERISFSISDFSFGYAGEEGTLAHAIRFDVFNNSAYGYRNPLFLLGLYQNQNLVGIMRFDLIDFESREKRTMDLRNYSENISVNEIRLYPVIDLYDNSVYLLPKR